MERFVFSKDNRLLTAGLTASREAPLVVDSWLVEEGRVRELQRHERRFRDSCELLVEGLDRKVLDSFLEEVRLALPRDGRWFPRIEAYAGGSARLALWLRGAPESRASTSLWVSPDPDPRALPRVKGPDLATLGALRERARLQGAEDALLCATDGSTLEAAHAAVVWWRGEMLCLSAEQSRVLPSVTEAVLVELARRRGVGIVYERRLPAELGELETWTLNALHGIRPVCQWHGSGPPTSAPVARERVERWTNALRTLDRLIDGADRLESGLVESGPVRP